MKTLLFVCCFITLCLSSQLARGHGGETHSHVQNPYSEEGCNVERGCFMCIDSCGANAAWVPDPDENIIRFTVWGPMSGNTGHISLGISQDNKMFAADVYSCIVDGSSPSLKRYWTPATGRNAIPATKKGVSDDEVMQVEGEIRCQFTRNMSLDDNDPQFYDVRGNQTYYLLLAAANSLNSGNIIGHNSRGPSGPVVLSQTFSAAVGEEPGLPLMKAHGCLMIIAWLGLVTVGITMARYYKPMWPESKICGVKVWFAIHRACMVTALLLFIVGFIIIVVHVKGVIGLDTTNSDTTRRFVHTLLGFIVTGLGILNPIMAIFRPHPGTSNRPIFNWAHWGVGTSASTLAFVTIGLALAEMGGTTIIPGLDSYLVWVFVAFAVFHVVMWIILDILKCTTDSEGRTDDIPLSGKADGPPPANDEAPAGSVLKTILIIVYCLGVLFAVAFLVITIAIA